MTEEKKDNQPDVSWLDEVLQEAAEKQKDAPAMIPPAVSSVENQYVNVSAEEREKKFKRGNYIILFFIIIQIIALVVVILW